MKIKRKTRVTFSDNSVNVKLPESWADLTQEELYIVLSRLAIFNGPEDDPRLMVFLKLTGIAPAKGVEPDADGKVKFIAPIPGGAPKALWLSSGELLSVVKQLNWIYEPGNVPVRLESILGAKAVNAKFRKLPFADYLKIENLYQAFLKTQDSAHIRSMEQILYPGIAYKLDSMQTRTLNMLNWVSQVKAMFSAMFPNLFQKVGSDGAAPNMTEIMNNQIRALSGGDITKENEVLESDCWRALTELDYKAKEAEEHRRQLAKLKK